MIGGPPGFSAPLGGEALPQGIPVVGATANLSLLRAVSSDPSSSPGLAAGVGTSATDGTHTWIKYGTNDTDWWQVQNVGAATTRDILTARAMAAMGVASVYTWFDDFDTSAPNWERSVGVGTGAGIAYHNSLSPLGTYQDEFGGIIGLRGGGGSASCPANAVTTLEIGDATNGRPSVLPPSYTEARGYFAARMKLNGGGTLSSPTEMYGLELADVNGVQRAFMGWAGWDTAGGPTYYNFVGKAGSIGYDNSSLALGAGASPSGEWRIWEAWTTATSTGLTLRLLTDAWAVAATGQTSHFSFAYAVHPRLRADPYGGNYPTTSPQISVDFVFAAFPLASRFAS